MADFFTLTGPEVRFGAGTVLLDISTAIDVTEYDLLTVNFYCTCLVPDPSSPSFTIDVYTGMQIDSYDDWKSALSETITVAGSSTTKQLGSGGFLRYITWGLTATNVLAHGGGLCIRVAARKKTLAIV